MFLRVFLLLEEDRLLIRKIFTLLMLGLVISSLLVTGCKSQTKEEMVQEGIRLSQEGNPNEIGRASCRESV